MAVCRPRERRNGGRLGIRGLGIACVQIRAVPEADVRVRPYERAEVHAVADGDGGGGVRARGQAAGFGAFVFGDLRAYRLEPFFRGPELGRV